MQVITKTDSCFFLRFDREEELTQSLTEFCQKQQINAGSFTALGATKNLLLSYYNLETKSYEDKEITEDVEIISIVGNIAYLSEKVIIHMHGSFSKRDFSMVGGHIKKLVISATCEVTLFVFKDKIERAYDSVTGLNLLK